jgi:sugar phosphate isomerase/epimerase
MQFGVCGGVEMAAAARAGGYAYLEGSVGGVLKPLDPEAAFEAALAALRAAPLPCPALNSFVPGSLKIVGPTADPAALEAYVTTVFGRAKRAGVSVIVFGSSGARNVPDGWDRQQAWEQLVAFGRMCAPRAAAQGVTLAIEPLNRRESNILNTVAEGAELARAVNHPAMRLLADAYHWLLDDNCAGDIVANSRLLAHVHVATAPSRLPPGAEPCEGLAGFFRALQQAGYDGRVSFEGKMPDPAAQLPAALKILRELAS